MSLHDDLLAVVDEVRNVLSPTELDQIRHQVTIRTRTWSGGAKGIGTATDVDLVLPQKFRVDPMTIADVSGSGGNYEIGDIQVRHITPTNADHTVGFTPEQLDPTITTDAQEVLYVVTGPHAGEYALQDLRNFKNYSWTLVLRRRNTTP